jgi:hypothetical protein
VSWFEGGIDIKPCRIERNWLKYITKKMTNHISIIQMIGCRSAAGVCNGLKVAHDSDLATHLSCRITTNGASYRSSILK